MKEAHPSSELPPSELRLRLLHLVRDLFVVRLLEDRKVVKDYFLVGGKRTGKFEPERVRELLSDFNRWAGWEVFDLPAWEMPGPGAQLAELYHELELSRFWPVGMPVEILGALWEENLPAAKRTGLFYTPKRIVEMVLETALQGFNSSAREEPLRLLDPACGSGYFLLAALRKLIREEEARLRAEGGLFAPLRKGVSGRLVLTPARRMELFSEHLFGVDIDPEALELARRALFLEVLSDTEAFSELAPSPAPFFSNLKEGDSILDTSFPQQFDLFEEPRPPAWKPFDFKDYEHGFGKVAAGEGGFNCIVGNPPWISLKGRYRQAPYSAEVVEYLVRRYDADTYRPNVVEFFIRRAVELLREGGWNSFVVPDRVAENRQFEKLREFMARKGEVLLLHFREPFPGVTADTLIYAFQRKRKPRRTLRIAVTDAEGRSMEAPFQHWPKGLAYLPADTRGDELEQLLKKIEAAGRRRLSDFLETGVGFIAKPGRITKDRTTENQRPVIKGEHISPYRREGSAFFEFTLNNLAGGTRDLEKLSRKDRILIRKTGARLIAAMDDTGDLPEQSLYFVFKRDRRLSRPYDLRFFLGLLNSRTMTFYYKHKKITNRASTPQIKKEHLDSFPIRPINFADPEARALHDGLCAAVAARMEEKDPAAVARRDREVEEWVAKLYGLSEQDLALILRHTETAD